MILLLDMLPYEPHMGANFIPYEAVEAHLEQEHLLRQARLKAVAHAEKLALPTGHVQRDRMPIPTKD